LSFYDTTNLSNGERFTLMVIIIESINTALSIVKVNEKDLMNLKNILSRDFILHENTLDDWADWEQVDLDESHIITPFIRSVIRSNKKSID